MELRILSYEIIFTLFTLDCQTAFQQISVHGDVKKLKIATPDLKKYTRLFWLFLENKIVFCVSFTLF